MNERRRRPRRRSDPGLRAGLLAASVVGVLWLLSSLPGARESAPAEPAPRSDPEPAKVRHIGPEDNEFDGEVRRGGRRGGGTEAPPDLASREEWKEALRIGEEAYEAIVAAVERHAAGNADTYRADMDDARRRLEEALDLLRPLQEEFPPGTPARDALEEVTQRFLRLARDAARL